jgi:DNA-binding NtrC family response regulator
MANNRPHVLVADDHPLIAWALTKFLEPLGFEVCVAATRAEARGQLMANRYDNVVMSARIGNAGMLDVLAEVARFQPLTKLFVLTEPGDTELVAQSVPSARIFEKPFGVAALADAVRDNPEGDGGKVDIPA